MAGHTRLPVQVLRPLFAAGCEEPHCVVRFACVQIHPRIPRWDHPDNNESDRSTEADTYIPRPSVRELLEIRQRPRYYLSRILPLFYRTFWARWVNHLDNYQTYHYEIRTSTSSASYCFSLNPAVLPFFSFSYCAALRSRASLAASRVGLLANAHSKSRALRDVTPLFGRAHTVGFYQVPR
jgi:hypothetical protein